MCSGAGDVCQETSGRGRETAHHTVHTHVVLMQLPILGNTVYAVHISMCH